MYPTYKNLNLPKIDKDILQFWEEHDVFKQSIAQRDGAESFVFYEGPPSANGKPGIHHVIARTIKDLFCRYQTLNGKRVERKGGWDTHGLPIELNVEKELGITKEDIGKTITVDEYNQKCRETVMRFKNEWDDITRKMGYWVDLEHPYITFENNYIESVWWLLQRLYDKGLLYKGYTIQPYSPAAGTGLSTHELNQPGCYREVTDTTVVGMFKVLKDEKSAFLYDSEDEDVRILAWTTTPWTLPSNTALTVGPEIEYVKVRTFNPYTYEQISIILAKRAVEDMRYLGRPSKALESVWTNNLPSDTVKKIQGWIYYGVKCDINLSSEYLNFDSQKRQIPYDYNPNKIIKGKNLEGIRYEPLLDFGNPIEPLLGSNGYGTDAYRVLVGDFVTTEDGTGVVHTAPSFGADDMRVAKNNGIGALTLVDKQGKFKDTVGEFSGRYVKNYTDDPAWESVDIDIAVHLKQAGKAFNVQKYAHNYPHCWRTDKPVLYYPLDSWFVRASAAKERMYELNQTINWKPASTGEGRFGKWLENLQDWNLSRSRYWGIPLPIWRNADATQEKCIGSVEELAQEIAKANVALGLQQNVPADLHRPYIDDVVLVTEDGQPMRRELDLIDVWFDSGAMPYAQFHFGPTPALPRGKGAVEGNGEETPFFQTADPTKYGKLKDFARQNRKNQTLGEEAMWQLVKGKNVGGFKFRRQHIIGDVIVDFVCLSRLLVVEVDGGYHSTPEAQEYDRLRTEYLGEQGYKVVRFSNEHIINAPDEVEQILLKELNHRPLFTKEQIREGKHLTPPFGGAGGRGAFPADFISEGVDQTRGWFYTLHAIATMVFDSVAFKNVLSTGLVLDAKGEKMSKTKGNVANPFEVIAQHGADATRWYMMSNTDPWENLKFSTDGIVESRNKFFGTLFNTYNFFAMYAGIDKFVMDEYNVMPYSERSELDRWIISKLYHLVADYREAMDDYEPTKACRAIENFVDEHLSNWYVRLSRRRFWKASTDDDGKDKMAAYQTLFECLMVVTQLASPVAPFFSDWMYRNLTAPLRDKAKAGASPLRHESVHLSDLTQPDPTKVDAALEQRMDYAQRICSLALSLRKREKLRVRQPLQKILLPILDPSFQEQVDAVADLIKAEINVKEIEYVTDTSGIITKKAKPNFKTLGKRLGKAMKAAADVIAALSQEQINAFERSKTLSISIEGQAFELEPEDLDIVTEDIPGWMVASDGEITVALDVTLTPELEAEGAARDLVNRIQNIRKERDYNVTDRIVVTVERHELVTPAIAQFSAYIMGETLADALQVADELPNGEVVEMAGDVTVRIQVERP